MSLWSQSLVLSLLQHKMMFIFFNYGLVDFKIGDKAGSVLERGYDVIDSSLSCNINMGHNI